MAFDACQLLFCLSFLVIGYTRFESTEDALASDVRRRLLEAVSQKPGLRLGELTEAVGIARSSAQHHVRILASHGLVRTVRSSRRTSVFPADAPAEARGRAMGVGENVLTSVASGKARSRAELRRALPDVPRRTLDYHVHRLVCTGSIQDLGGTLHSTGAGFGLNR